jgi:sortase B
LTITNKISILSILVICSLISVAAVCGIFFFNEYRRARKEIAEYTEIQSSYTSVLTESAATVGGGTLPDAAARMGLPYVAVDFDSLLAINPETVGWLAIPGTEISYPVLQAENNSKYLNTSFGGERSGTGAIFMDHGNSAEPLDTNTVIYGHNMGRGRTDMFGSLLAYKEESYCVEHPRIQFDTIYRRYGWWEVFAVVNLDVKTTGFDYLKQNFGSAVEFEAWIAQAKELSIYDTGVNAALGGKCLVLSTCDRSVSKNGRLLVMAVWTGMEDGL